MSLVCASALGIARGGVDHIVAVTGRDAELVRNALAGLEIAFVTNAEYASGMSSSLRVGVSEALRRWPDAKGLMVALGDQPLAGTGIVERVVATFEEKGPLGRESIVAPRFRGAQGNPVIFGGALVPELLAIVGDRGARSVVENNACRVEYVDFDREPPLDIDTVQDLAELTH